MPFLEVLGGKQPLDIVLLQRKIFFPREVMGAALPLRMDRKPCQLTGYRPLLTPSVWFIYSHILRNDVR